VLAPASAAAVIAFVAWTLAHSANADRLGLSPFAVGIAAAVVAAIVPSLRPRWAFVANGLAIALLFTTLFVDLFPNVLVSSTSGAFDLTLGNAASGSYTLTVMTVVAAVLLPAILAAQLYAYWVFRHPVAREDLEEPGGKVVELPRPDDERDRADVG
jgi:cytochrome d ubiquinol oxidase subunit II